MPDADIDAIREILTAHPRPTDLAERRQRLDALGARYEVGKDIRVEAVNSGGVAAEWTTSPVADPTRAVLFFHGGGYVSGSIASHRHLVAQVGRESRARTLAVGYRLAPEHPFPAALDDALASYRFLLDAGYSASRIVVAGESAGGGLAVALMTSLRERRMPLPAGAWLSSPWVDLAMTGSSMTGKEGVDPLISKAYLQELAAAYLHGADNRNPLASPLYANLHGLPALLIQVGSAETLLDDAVRLAGAAGNADVRTTLEVWPDMIHAFTLFYQQVAAARRALTNVGAFVRAVTA